MGYQFVKSLLWKILMHPLAAETNARIPAHILSLFSAKGREIFFPSRGILGQSAEAKNADINATIGIALEDDGSPMRLAGLEDTVGVPPRDAFPYAPSYGKPALRSLWQEMIRVKNPSLKSTPISVPVVSQALTHALSVCGSLFLDPGDNLLLPHLYWGNYRLIFAHGYGAQMVSYPTFEGDGFNLPALEDALMSGPPGKRVILMNFPNNPTGYTCTINEAHAIRDLLVRVAEAGRPTVCLIDDAYFGLVYEEGIFEESLFALLADAHPSVLAVKIDGATKEDYAWGLRVGFVTYGFKGARKEALIALEDKTAGTVRSQISNASHLSQSLLLDAYRASAFPQWKAEKKEVLSRRYATVKAVLDAHPQYLESFTPLPFNSGYFMCVRPVHAEPETLRRHLLAHYKTGVIATGDLIRIAYSSAPTHSLRQLFSNLDAACRACAS